VDTIYVTGLVYISETLANSSLNVLGIFLTAADVSSKVWFMSMEIMNYQETVQQKMNIFFATPSMGNVMWQHMRQ